MNKTLKTLGAAVLAVLLGGAGAAHAGSSSAAGGSASGPKTTVDIASEDNGTKALLDTLVVKGLLTDQEAEQINEKVIKDTMSSPMIQFNSAAGIKRIMLFGDLRLRYEVRDGHQPAGATVSGGTTPTGLNDNETRDRFRYRLRVGAKFDLTDAWYGALRLDTGVNNPRSGNVTFGQQSGAVANNSNGPFGKGNAGVGVGQAYLGWKATDYLTFQIGRMPNPFYTTSLVWDPNLPVDGVSEMFHTKINKNLEFFANFAQAMYSDATNDNAPTGTANWSDMYLLKEQVGLNVTFADDIKGKIAAGVSTYTGSRTNTDAGAVGGLGAGAGSQPTGFAGPFNGDYSDVAGGPSLSGNGNNFGVNNLNVIEIPAELNFKAWNTPFKLYENFAINADADTRARLATHAGRGSDDGYAYQAGVQVGSAKKKGQWETSVWWQRTGTYAVDPNLVDGRYLRWPDEHAGHRPERDV